MQYLCYITIQAVEAAREQAQTYKYIQILQPYSKLLY